MLDADMWIKAALAALPIPMSREPMSVPDRTKSWLTWRQTSGKDLFASGKRFGSSVNLTMTLACPADEDHQQLAGAIVAKLRGYAQGNEQCGYARVGGDSWDPTILRRSVIIFLGIREVLI